MSDDELDRLFGVAPEAFMALRTELVAAAKKRGDKEAATRIGAARRPTVAAWVVNLLVRAEDTARPRLAELSERLRAAHAAMDGDRIRESSAAQRKLVDELVRAGFAAAELPQPSAALRDDVVATLQAAIADPEVAERLGRLSKAVRWSGFGEFGASTAEVTHVRATSRPPARTPEPAEDVQRRKAAQRRRAAAGADVARASAAHDEATDAVATRRGALTTARRRYEKLLVTLSAAEHEVNGAESELDDAERVARSAADRLARARADLAAESDPA